MTSWKLTGAGGMVVGYLAVDIRRKRDDLTFDVSRASPDRRPGTWELTPPGRHGQAHPSRKARAAAITLRWASSASCSSSPLLSTSNGALSSS